MKLEVNFDTVLLDDWDTTIGSVLRAEIQAAIRLEVRKLVKAHKKQIEATATGIIKSALDDIQTTHREALAAKVSELFKKEVMK